MYPGTPLCGACRAIRRLTGLLRSGHLVDQEKRVTEVLRGAAGELSDLAEASAPKGRAAEPVPPKEGPSLRATRGS